MNRSPSWLKHGSRAEIPIGATPQIRLKASSFQRNLDKDIPSSVTVWDSMKSDSSNGMQIYHIPIHWSVA